MDMMDIKIMIMRTLKREWAQMFLLSAFLGCIASVTVIAAGVIKNLSDFLILKRMCFMFLSVSIAGTFVLELIVSVLLFWSRRREKSAKILAAQKKSEQEKNESTVTEESTVKGSNSEPPSASLSTDKQPDEVPL